MLLLSLASLEKDGWTANKNKKPNTFSCPPELATGSWLHTWSGWLGAWGRQSGPETHSLLAKEAKGRGTPVPVQQQHWWQYMSSWAARACRWRQDEDKSRAGWALRSQQNLFRGRNRPVSWPASCNWSLLLSNASLGLEHQLDKNQNLHLFTFK